MIGRITLAFLVVASWAGQALALGVTIEAERRQVTVGEQFTIEVEVTHGGVGSVPVPALAPVEHLRQISSYDSRNFSYVNGKMRASVAIQYVMVADEPGTYAIKPVTVRKGGESATSNAINIKVAPAGSGVNVRRLGENAAGGANTETAKDLIVLGKVDNDAPYVNEQITYTFTFLRRVRILQGSRYTQPVTTGFWVEELDSTEPTEVMVEGRRYVAERVRMALFPTGDGEYTIGEAVLHASVEERRSRRRRDPFDIFGGSSFGRRGGRQVILQTDPVTINVRALPQEGKPVDFSGAVGRFELTADVDRTEMKAGEPVTLTVNMSGQGNVKVVPAPDLSILEDFKIYESKSSESSVPRDGHIEGSKTWEFVLVPTTGGDVEIPPVRLSVFDPSKDRYVNLATAAIPLSVEATDLDDAIARGDDLLVAKERVRLRQRDIRYVKSAPAELRATASSPLTSPGFLLAHMVPVLAMAGSTLLRRHRHKLKSDLGYARSRQAAKAATKHLKESREALSAGNLGEFFGLLSVALRGYAADKLHLAAANLSEGKVREGLRKAGVEPGKADELFGMLEACDSARFSPLGSDAIRAAKLLEAASTWITKVERR